VTQAALEAQQLDFEARKRVQARKSGTGRASLEKQPNVPSNLGRPAAEVGLCAAVRVVMLASLCSQLMHALLASRDIHEIVQCPAFPCGFLLVPPA